MKTLSTPGICLLALVSLSVSPVPAQEEAAQEEEDDPTIFMSAAWAEDACDAWNENETLTQELAGWIENDLDRGYKIMQIYRIDCEDSPRIEMKISLEDGLTKCTYGGAVQSAELDPDADYLMFATTQRWQEMGAGDYGPFKAMMTGRLKFSGPKWEAMRNMGPFGSFLQLAGSVPGDIDTCP